MILNEGSATTENVKFNSTDKYYTRDGRKYNATTEYLFPMDEGENGRLNRLNTAYNLLFGGIYQSPIKEQLENGIKVLDSACGSGAHWTLQMAKEFPSSYFIGVDISNVFPVEAPSNTNFLMENVSKKIPFPDETFDFAIQKLLGLAFTSEEWDSNIKELYRVLKPNGRVELSEFAVASAYNTGPLMENLMQKLRAVTKSKNIITSTAYLQIADRLVKAGFTHEVLIIREMPQNHSEHGKLYWDCIKEAFISLRPVLVQVCAEWDDVLVFEDFLNSVGKECAESKCYFEWRICYAQK